MRSKSVHTNRYLPQTITYNFAKVLAAIAISILLSACGGGISGTGDGGPRITPTESLDNTGTASNVDAGSDSAPDSSADSADSNVTDGADPTTQAPTINGTNLLLPDVSTLVPDALLQTNVRNEGISSTVSFTTQLITLTQEVTATINAINSDQATQAPEQSAQFNDSRFNNITGYSLDGTDIVVASADTTDLRFFFSDNSQRAIHVFQQDGALTVRRLDRNRNSVFQATIVSLTDSAIIGAALNENGIQTYIQSYSTAQFTAAFIQHPTDPTIPRQRELIDPSGAVTVVENCTGVLADCLSDSDFSSTDANANLQFLNAAQTIATALSAPENAPLNTLADGVNEAVLAESGITQPTEDQIQCGLQTVDGNIRFFCFRPLPLESEVSLFSETVAGGQIFYQLLE